MKAGSTVDSATRADPVFGSIRLDGAGTFFSSSSDADRDNRNFSGTISGTGSLTVTGRNVEVYTFNSTTANTYSGGTFFTANDRYVVRANTTGAFGTGNVTVSPRANADNRSAAVYFAADNIMASSATLSLTGTGGGSSTGFATEFNSNSALIHLATGTNTNLAALFYNGVDQGAGVFTNSVATPWILGSGTLTVIPEPSAALLGALGALALLRRRR